MWAKRHSSQSWALPKLDTEQTWQILIVVLVLMAILALRFRPETPVAEPVAAVVEEKAPVVATPEPLQIQQVVHEMVAPPLVPSQIAIARSETLEDGDLLVVAKVIDAEGEPVPDQIIEWSINDEGIGTIVDVSRPAGTGGNPERVSVLLARSRTAKTKLPTDDIVIGGIEIGTGESWCLVRASGAGMTTLTALAPGIDPASTREATMSHRWMPLTVGFPGSGRALVGSKILVTTALADPAGQPAAGYRVRYILDEAGGISLSGSAQSVDIVTDANGRAALPLEQLNPVAGTTHLRAQLLGAQIRTTAMPAVLDEKEIAIEWLDPDFHIEATAPEPVRVDEPATVPIAVTVEGDRIPPGFRLFLLLPAGLDLPGKESQREIDLGDPGTFESAFAIPLTSTTPGKRTVRLELRDASRIRSARELEVTHALPAVRVEHQQPARWQVGTSGRYEIRVTNDGPVPAHRLRVVDDIPVTLDVAGVDGGLRFADHVEWNIGRLEVGASQVLSVAGTPTRPIRDLSLRGRAEEDGRRLGEAVRTFHAEGLASLNFSVRDLRDPVLVGEEVEYQIQIENRGTAVAHDIYVMGDLPEELEVTGVEGLVKSRFEGLKASLGPIAELSPGQSVWCRIRAKAKRTGEARLTLRLHHEAVGNAEVVAEESTIVYEPQVSTP